MIIFLSISLNMCFGAQKNHLIEMVLLSTHNICLGSEIRQKNFSYTLLSGVLSLNAYSPFLFEIILSYAQMF